MIICDKAYEDDLNHLQSDVYRYYDLYFQCFINNKENPATMTFKMHNLSHYADCIRQFGPLLFLSTCKYERLHQLMKSFVSGSFNKRNPPYSTISSYAKVWFNHAFDDKSSSDLLKFISHEDIHEDIPAEFRTFIDCESDLDELKQLVQFDIEFKKEFLFVYYAHDVNNRQLPLFARVKRLFYQHNQYIILARLMKTISFDKNSHYYIVESESNHSQVQLEPKNLPWYKNLRLHKHKDRDVIERDFHFGYVSCHEGILPGETIA